MSDLRVLAVRGPYGVAPSGADEFPRTTLSGDLEAIYAATLLDWIRESSLDAVVLLAHELVYDSDGKPRSDLGSMFVPNDVVLELARLHPEFLAGVSIHPARSDTLSPRVYMRGTCRFLRSTHAMHAPLTIAVDPK